MFPEPRANGRGPGDASLDFDVAVDEESLAIAMRVLDDRIHARDRIRLVIDPRPFEQRLADPRLPRDSVIVQMKPNAELTSMTVETARLYGGKKLESAEVAFNKDNGKIAIELKLPVDLVSRMPPADANAQDSGRGFQLGVVAVDVDEDSDADCQLSWRGANPTRTNTRMGHFFLER